MKSCPYTILRSLDSWACESWKNISKLCEKINNRVNVSRPWMYTRTLMIKTRINHHNKFYVSFPITHCEVRRLTDINDTKLEREKWKENSSINIGVENEY